MNKSVLYIGGFELPDKNAAAQRVIANAKLLRMMGFSVSFIGISKDIERAPHIVDDFPSNPVPYPVSINQWKHQILTFIELSEIIRIRPDYVILYNFPAIASLRILKVCKKNKIKVIHDITEWEFTKGWSIRSIVQRGDIALRMRYSMKKMDGVIAISRYLYDYYKTYTNTILVPPTVDLRNPKFCRDRVLSASEGITKLVYAGSAGSFAAKDRLDFIIESVNKYPNLQLDIVGMTKEQYQEAFGDNSIINDNVRFHGRVSHREAIKYVCEADFQMLIRENTLKNKAGFPTKFVESFSCCTPLIATITSNICDYLQDGINGFLVTDKRPLDKVLEDVSKISASEKLKMKEACKSFVGFDYRCYAEDFSKIFKQ